MVYSDSQRKENISFLLIHLNPIRIHRTQRVWWIFYYSFQPFKVEPLFKNEILQILHIDLFFDGVEYL